MCEVRGTLELLVTIAGALLFAVVFLFVVRGNKLPADKNGPNTIKYKGIELKTNQVVMLALVFAAIMVAPVVLEYLRDDRLAKMQTEVDRKQGEIDKLQAELTRINETPLHVIATLGKGGDKWLSKAQGYIQRVHHGQVGHPECSQRLLNGVFDCSTVVLKAMDDAYEFHVDLNDDALVKRVLRPTELTVDFPQVKEP
jgi:hypothetical protein